jgi:hypothetical protein
MKAIFKTTVYAALAAGLLSSCVNDDDYGIPALECVETSLVANMEPEAVPATPTATQYNGDGIIEAYVTSSDAGGNFYKSISFQTLDGSFGFSVPVDNASYAATFDVGRKVLIKLDGTYTDIAHDGVRIGALYEGAVGRLSADQAADVLNRSCTIVSEEDLVQDLTIAQTLNDARINTLVELQNVEFVASAVGGTYYDEDNVLGGATNLLLEDAAGNTIIFRTSSFASYAGSEVPAGSGTVRGVLTKFNNDYQFVARYESDINLDQPRFGEEPVEPVDAFYEEDFQEAVDNTDFNIAGWANITEAGTRKWSEQTFDGNGYAEFSSFGSGAASNVAWLVTPAIDMNSHTGEVLAFETAQHHLDGDSDGNKLEIFVFTSFNGTDIAGATKIEVTDQVALPTSATAWYEFVASGNVDLSSYTGNIYIAFKFTGSGSNTALDGAFQIDNLTVSGN